LELIDFQDSTQVPDLVVNVLRVGQEMIVLNQFVQKVATHLVVIVQFQEHVFVLQDLKENFVQKKFVKISLAFKDMQTQNNVNVNALLVGLEPIVVHQFVTQIVLSMVLVSALEFVHVLMDGKELVVQNPFA